MRYYIIIFTILIFSGCTQKELTPQKKEKVYSSEIYDLVNIPQRVNTFTSGINFTQMSYINQNKYEKSYFTPWNIDKPSINKKDAMWPFDSYKLGKSYGENLQLLKKNFFTQMREEFNLEDYASLNKKAITIKYANIRAFPTERPLLLNPSKAGEGFPFDYLQNSTIQANKPIFVSHYSKSGEWAFIESSFTFGWIKTNELVFLEKNQTDIWQAAQQVFLTKEGVALLTEDGKFLFNSKIGTMLALVSESEDFYTLLVVSSLSSEKPLFVKSKISKSIASKSSLAFNASNLENIINEVSQSNYGWGGIYAQRDCSSMLRDIFAPFGIWLPRNSYTQSKIGEVIQLEGLSDTQKIATIKAKALPFKTLLYKKGHIMLYVGTYNGEVIAFHDTWGIKTNESGIEGRIVIGKPVFSTLKLGSHQEFYDESSEMLRNLKSMNILNY